MEFFTKSPQTNAWFNRLCVPVIALMCFSPSTVLADDIFLEVRRDQQETMPIASLQSMDARVGDVLSIRSEYGDVHDFRIHTARRSSLGNRVVSGTSDAGARVMMVITSEGKLQGSIRDGDMAYRLTQSADGLQWHYADPAMARPVDNGGVLRPRARSQRESVAITTGRRAMKLKAQKSLADQTISYPQFGSGTATLDVLFYYEAGMEDPEGIADFVTEVTNQAMTDSRIELQVNIVGVKPVEVEASLLQEEVLDQMFDGAGVFSDIEVDRSFYGADLVLTLRENIPANDDACGIAYVGVYDGEPWRQLYTAVVQWLPVEAPGSDYCTDTTTAHEIGHVLGSQHERRIAEPGDEGAYSYSFGHYGVRFHTIMSYGDEPEKAVFSNPNLIACQGLPCGLPEGDPESADNARAFTQTRFMLAGYQGESFAYELVRDLAIDEECQLDEGGEGLRRGHGISNDTALSVDIRAFSVLTRSGEVLVDEFDAGDRTLDSGYVLGPTCKPLTDNNPYGEEYVESWVTYANPLSGALIESVHLRWNNDYAGPYARVNIGSSAQGTVEGHTTYLVTPEESRSFTFLPASGFALADVKSSCGGERAGNTFSIAGVVSDCVIEPVFEADVTPGSTLRVLLEEPIGGDTYSGVGNLRGWSVATVGVERIEVWINDQFAFNAPYGGLRNDVGNAFPDIEGGAESGFSLAWNYSNMEQGEHKITVRSYDMNGQFAESSSTFFVTRFHKPFLGPEDVIDLSGAQCTVSDNQISLSDAIMDGSVYDVLLQWRTAAQDFQIIEIR